jgi:hypothetical protein
VTSRVLWRPSYRLIRARLPRIDIFESIASPDDLPAVLAIEALTNPRLREAIGPIAAIPVNERAAGPGAAFIMAPFAYPSRARFSDGTFGAYYAAHDLETAIAEVSFQRAYFAAQTPTPPMDFDERVIEADLDGVLTDLRGISRDDPIFDPDPEHYTVGEAFARKARAAGSGGLVYQSLRRRDWECVALFTPGAVRRARTTGYIGLRWDGHAIVDAFRKASLTQVYPQ